MDSINSLVDLLNEVPINVQLFSEKIKELDPKLIDQKNIYEATLLRCSLLKNNIDIASIILDHRADINFKFSNGDSILHESVYRSGKFYEFLLSRGADPNIFDIRGYTPIFIALKLARIKCIKTLVFYGADLNYKPDIHSKSLLQLSISNGENIKLIVFLLNNGAKIDFDDGFIDNCINICKRNIENNHGEDVYDFDNLKFIIIYAKIKKILSDFLGNISLKNLCLNIMRENKFSLENLPESFFR